MKYFLSSILAGLLAFPPQAFAAIGCTLNNPAEDLKYLFPGMTSYREELKEFGKLPDGKKAFEDLPARLRGELDPVYETYETAYTVYWVFKGKEKLGLVHGVNVPGQGGVIQVFLSLDPKTGTIRKFFFQRLESPAASALRAKAFRDQFTGLTLADLYKHDYYQVADPGSKEDKLGGFRMPKVTSGKKDLETALRGVRKNLVLMDLFVFGGMYEPFFERAKKVGAKALGGEP